jgi:class 3 adenylate cyclase
VHAVEDGGGEVLKFIGDALLAVFPLSERHHIADVACEVALAAAEEAIDTIANANKTAVTQSNPKSSWELRSMWAKLCSAISARKTAWILQSLAPRST